MLILLLHTQSWCCIYSCSVTTIQINYCKVVLSISMCMVLSCAFCIPHTSRHLYLVMHAVSFTLYIISLLLMFNLTCPTLFGCGGDGGVWTLPWTGLSCWIIRVNLSFVSCYNSWAGFIIYDLIQQFLAQKHRSLPSQEQSLQKSPRAPESSLQIHWHVL